MDKNIYFITTNEYAQNRRELYDLCYYRLGFPKNVYTRIVVVRYLLILMIQIIKTYNYISLRLG